MKHTSYQLWSQLDKSICLPHLSDRVWCDLVSILLHSGAGDTQNDIALSYLFRLNDTIGDIAEHRKVLKQATDWLRAIN